MSVNNFYRNISKDKEIDKNYKRLYHKYKKKYLNLKQKYFVFLLKEDHQGAAERPQLKRQSSLEEIDENNIQDCSSKLDNNCFTIDGKIIFGYHTFEIPKQQQETQAGTYGEVTIYESTTTEKKMAIKTFNDPIEYYREKLISIIISKKQKNLKNALQIVPSYWHEKDNKGKIVMHGKDGNLVDKFLEVDYIKITDTFLSSVKNHFTETVKAIKLLWENKLYYCDLKLENVLYEKNGTEDKTYLADIGGVTYFNEEVDMDFFKSIKEYDLYIEKESLKMYLGNDDVFGIVSDEWREKIDGTIIETDDYFQILTNQKLSGTIKLSSSTGIFTYPLTKGGTVYLTNSEIENKLDLLNNIFHSIIVFLFILLSGKKYYFLFDSHNIRQSVIEVNSWINMSELKPEIKSKLKKLTNYLNLQSDNINKFLYLDGNIVEKINNKDIEKKFDDIISLVENIEI